MAEQASARRGTSGSLLGLHLALFLTAVVAWFFLVAVTGQMFAGFAGPSLAVNAVVFGPLLAWGGVLFLHAALVAGSAVLGRPIVRAIGGAVALLIIPVSAFVLFVGLRPVVDLSGRGDPREPWTSLPDPWLVPRLLLGGSVFPWLVLAVGTAIAVFALAVNGKERAMAEQTSQRGEEGGVKDAAAFRHHLAVYLTFALFFFVLNLLTSPTDLWFYWPLLFWGFALAIHAIEAYGADAPIKLLALIRSSATRARSSARVPSSPDSTTPSRTAAPREHVPSPDQADPMQRLMAEGEARVDAMRSQARRIPKPAVRDQALSLSASADRILAVLGETPENQQLASDFLSRYLTPAGAIISRYAHLAARNVPSAAPTLAKVEAEDLPLLDHKMSELYDRLHRGDLIDLEVAREMLAFDFASDPAPTPTAKTQRTADDPFPVRS